VGVKIFTGPNVSRGLPVPVVVRFDYQRQCAGSQGRGRCCNAAVRQRNRSCRSPKLFDQGLLQHLLTLRPTGEINTPPLKNDRAQSIQPRSSGRY